MAALKRATPAPIISLVIASVMELSGVASPDSWSEQAVPSSTRKSAETNRACDLGGSSHCGLLGQDVRAQRILRT